MFHFLEEAQTRREMRGAHIPSSSSSLDRTPASAPTVVSESSRRRLIGKWENHPFEPCPVAESPNLPRETSDVSAVESVVLDIGVSLDTGEPALSVEPSSVSAPRDSKKTPRA